VSAGPARRASDAWALGSGAPDGRPAARVEISSDGLWRVATRGISVDDALRQATISGDQVLGAAVLHLVSIVR
jgi:hypothetical protein